MLYFVYFSDAGVPKTGLTCTWEYLKDEDGSNTSNNPAFSEVGGGWYSFDIEYGSDSGPWESTGSTHLKALLGVIDGGSSLEDIDRYKPVCINHYHLYTTADKFVNIATTPWSLETRDPEGAVALRSQNMLDTDGGNITSAASVLGRLTTT